MGLFLVNLLFLEELSTTYDDSARDDPVVGQLARLRCKPCADERSPVVADHNTLPIFLQELLPDSDYELRHSFEYLVRPIVGQTIAATVSWQIHCYECMGLLQHRCLKDMSP